MSDTSAYLVVTSITNPGKMEQMQTYGSQIMPILIKGGAEPIARYGVIEQLNSDGGPNSIAVMKFASTQAIKGALSSDEYKALEKLRSEAFSQVALMICAAL